MLLDTPAAKLSVDETVRLPLDGHEGLLGGRPTRTHGAPS